MSPDDVPRPVTSGPPALSRPTEPTRSAAWGDPTPVRNDTVVAILGPTNTGKTHYAVERLLGHRTGVIGFPLRLLAREIYDRIVGVRGPRDVALITGEEKIVPVDARYYICTVESMPLDWAPDFVAVDEIQLCADPERGHVFTDRLLNARGRNETLFLGSATIWDRIAALAPGARFITRERMSQLTYSGSKKLSRLPTRSAIVGFSADNVYAIAELIRRQKGGAAVVMGALSPRTRNAQVALYQEGDVDYLVATDAIGMGLNMDVRHVAFSGLRKFDGRRHRYLEANELAQIAGRAGRHTNDGTFGVTGEAHPLDEDVIHAIENHAFKPIERLHWRNGRLDYATPFNLLLSLEREPSGRDLQRAREADDVIALRHLVRQPDVVDRAQGRSHVRLLWDVCQVPDFRKTLPSEHAALLSQLYEFLSNDVGVVPEDWIATQCARLDRIDGDIDALSKRLAYIRTWTYVANRGRWLADPGHWREKTREIEDKLSDALHARLTQRFVDRRTSVLARRLKQKEALVASIDDAGAVTVEGEFVGRLDGFRFAPDPAAAGAEVKTLQAASAQALQSELTRRVEKFYSSPDSEIDVTEQGGMMWGDAAVGRLEPLPENAADPLSARAVAFADDMLDPALKEKIERRLQFWIDRKLQTAFEPLFALKNDETLIGIARGVAFQLIERYGIIPRNQIADDVKSLDQDARGSLRKHGVRFGQHTVFIPALLKPAPTRFRILLWGLSRDLPEIPSAPPPGAVTIPAVDLDLPPENKNAYYPMAGYRLCGPRALRLDMLERLSDLIRQKDARAGFEATPEMMSITGATLEQLAEMLEGLGYRAEKAERPKQPKPQRPPNADAAKPEDAAKPVTDATETDASRVEASDVPTSGPETAEALSSTPAGAPDASDGTASEPVVAEASSNGTETIAGDADAAAAEVPSGEAAPEAAPSAATASAETAPLQTSQDAASASVALAEEGDAQTDDVTTVETAQQAAAEGETAEEENTEEPSASSDPAAPMAVETDAPSAETAPEPRQSDDGPASQEDAAARGAPTDVSTPELTEDAEPEAAAGPVEMETYYIFKLAPRGRRADAGDGGRQRRPHRRGGQNGSPANQQDGRQMTHAAGEAGQNGAGDRRRDDQGDGKDGGSGRHRRSDRQERSGDRQSGRSRRHDDGDKTAAQAKNGGANAGERRNNKRGKSDGKGGPKGGKPSTKPREFSSGPSKSNRVDADSPFAILQKLKDGS